jgi:hypothetical protein
MCEEFEIITYRRRGPERKTWAIYIRFEGPMFAVVPFARSDCNRWIDVSPRELDGFLEMKNLHGLFQLINLFDLIYSLLLYNLTFLSLFSSQPTIFLHKIIAQHDATFCCNGRGGCTQVQI